MSIKKILGVKLQKYGNRLIDEKMQAEYGKQIGITSTSGNRVFSKREGNYELLTALTWDNRIISRVSRLGNRMEGITKKMSYNRDGDLLEIAISKRTPERISNVRFNVQTGDVKSSLVTRGNKDTGIVPSVEKTNI